jgi:hypothetical protein
MHLDLFGLNVQQKLPLFISLREMPTSSILNKVTYMITSGNERGECVIGVYTEYDWVILVPLNICPIQA